MLGHCATLGLAGHATTADRRKLGNKSQVNAGNRYRQAVAGIGDHRQAGCLLRRNRLPSVLPTALKYR